MGVVKDMHGHSKTSGLGRKVQFGVWTWRYPFFSLQGVSGDLDKHSLGLANVLCHMWFQPKLDILIFLLNRTRHFFHRGTLPVTTMYIRR